MPMPCSPEITPPSDAREAHDARHRIGGGLQHLVVVGVDRDVGVHVAVARVHVQGDEYPPPEDLLVHRLRALQDLAERGAVEDAVQLVPHLGLPRQAQRVGLQLVEIVVEVGR